MPWITLAVVEIGRDDQGLPADIDCGATCVSAWKGRACRMGSIGLRETLLCRDETCSGADRHFD